MDEIKEVQQQLTDMRSEYWIQHDLFSMQWWLLIILLVLPWFVWWWLVDKTRIKNILLLGFLSSTPIVLLDDIGIQLQLWSYPYQLVKMVPRLNPIDFSVLPVLYMLLYQYFRSWKLYLLGSVIMALSFSYIAEPIFVRLNIYDLDNWKFTYSLPIYIGLAIFIRWIIEGIIKTSKTT